MLVVLATACAASPEGALVTGEPTEVSAEDSPGMERATPPGVPARVTRVVDGDTFEARIQGEIVDVRMIGIDTPETVHPTEPVECFGPEASAFTERRLEGSPVHLELDVERIDTFGRTLAYVWKGKRLFNEDIVRMGYATLATYPPNVAHVERLVEAERKARRDGLGIWDACLVPINTGGDWRDLSDA
jgi:micrococcal nuclease